MFFAQSLIYRTGPKYFYKEDDIYMATFDPGDSVASNVPLPGEETAGKIQCEHCKRYYNRSEFYQDKNGNPMKKCKACLASLINLNSRSTVLNILKEIDIPFIPEEWNRLRDRYEYIHKGGQTIRNPRANQSVLGRYIGKMKLNQFKEYTYADTPRFTETYDEEEKAEKEKFFEGLDELLQKGMTQQQALKALLVDENNEKNQEEKTKLNKTELEQLREKWGEAYQPNELKQLEIFYGEMHGSYDITTASHEDYLKQICKISLRMHSLIDAGMYDEYKKLSDIYDRMMKSAKFTASQEKSEDRYVDSISELVRLCEEKKFIPVYHKDEPQDIVDATLADFENYVRNLVATELNLDSLVEKGLELIKLEEEKDQMEEDDNGLLDDNLATSEEVISQLLGETKGGELTEEAKELGVELDG